MSEKVRVLLNEEEVDARIRQIAAQISKDYAGREVHLICVLKGGVFFTCELAKGLPCLYPWILCPFPAMEMTQSPPVL